MTEQIWWCNTDTMGWGAANGVQTCPSCYRDESYGCGWRWLLDGDTLEITDTIAQAVYDIGDLEELSPREVAAAVAAAFGIGGDPSEGGC